MFAYTQVLGKWQKRNCRKGGEKGQPAHCYISILTLLVLYSSLEDIVLLPCLYPFCIQPAMAFFQHWVGPMQSVHFQCIAPILVPKYVLRMVFSGPKRHYKELVTHES